ncbi:MAG: AAA family ATPase [Acidobacteriota bacterium]
MSTNDASPRPAEAATPSSAASSDVPTPRAVAARLQQHVIGQEEAIKEMAIALSKKLATLRVGNILMIGSSGTGKTTVMRAVERMLAEDGGLRLRPTVVRMHANVLGEEAQQGRPGEAVLQRLMQQARDQLGVAASLEAVLDHALRGIVFVDEIDKIRSHIGQRPNVAGIRAQEALLTVMENEAVPFTLPAWAGGETVTLDSSGLLFVCAGAFEGLYDAVYDRVTVGRDKGALKPTTVMEDGKVTERLDFRLRDWLKNDDLFEYGMSPQFLARYDAVVLLHDLTVDQLTDIFLESPESGYRQARAYFEGHGVHLALSPDGARLIAREASREPRLGARALKEVFRRVIRDYEFEPHRHVTGGGVLLLDAPDVARALGIKLPA